jgi:hypothetical protein
MKGVKWFGIAKKKKKDGILPDYKHCVHFKKAD